MPDLESETASEAPGLGGPLVSVVIPTRERPALLARALSSVYDQTWRAREVLVVDDGSAHPPTDVVARFPGARLLVLPERRGAASARNAGVRAALGDLVAFLDDDDVWLPTKLERQVERLTSAPPDVAAVYCGYRVVSDVTGEVASSYEPRLPAAGFAEFLDRTVFGTSIPLVRRRCLEEVGLFDESLPGTQDRDLWLALSRRFRFDFVPEVLSEQRIHGPQITSNLPAKIEAKERMLEKYLDDLREHPAVLANQLVRLANLHFAGGRRARGRRLLLDALRHGAKGKTVYPGVLLSLIAPGWHRRRVRASFRHVGGVPLYW
jgi:glycosyltransferase involved in cell wall biosynthesis